MVAYALAGSVRVDLTQEPLGVGKDGQPVYLRDIWPSQQEIADAVAKVDTAMFHKEYAEVFAGDEQWQAIEVPQAATYVWQADSTYIQHPPFFEDIGGGLLGESRLARDRRRYSGGHGQAEKTGNLGGDVVHRELHGG